MAIGTGKIKDSCLDRTQRCIEAAQPHLTFNKALSLHLQSTGRRRSPRVSFSSHIIIFRLHLSIIVYAGHILAPFKREEIRKEIFCLAR